MKSPLRPGDPASIGGYELLARLGEGGMGAVFLGRRDDGALVAIKIIKSEYAHEEEFRGRFRSEVKRARQVPPFCTAAVLDADPEHHTPYLVVEYVDGPSLDEVVAKEGPLTGSRLQSVAVGVATALTAIHGAGVIHRDLKPRNVLFDLGGPKVIDFGIARAMEVTSQHTHPDQMVGTVAYMAPERFDGIHRDITPAADVFAWGAVIAYAGTGRTPFRADSPVAVAARILTQPPDLTGLSGPLADLVALALAKDPEDRPTAHELLNLLLAQNTDPNGFHRPPAIDPRLREAAEAAQLSGHHVSGGGPRLGLPVPPAQPRKSRRLRTVVAATVAATLLATAVGLFSRGDDEPVGYDAFPAVQASMPVPGAVRGPWVVDALDRRGQWNTDTGEVSTGRCTFKNGMHVSTESYSMMCKGPGETFAGDQQISFTAATDTELSCAEVQFRATADKSYWLDLCPQLIRIRHEGALRSETLGSQESDLFAPGQRRKVVLTLSGTDASVAVDDEVILYATLNDPGLLAGTVLFGVGPIDASKNQEALVSVVFADAEIRPVDDGTVQPVAPATSLTFTDVRKGSSTSTVEVHAIYTKPRSVVVEPVLFMTGPEYCEAFGLQPSEEAPCERAWLTEDSNMTVTLPLSPDLKMFSVFEDPQKCAGNPVTVGTCKITPEAAIKRLESYSWYDITVKDGVVTAMAERYVP
ncbi:serine/threonine protein kinase [Actinoplanes couchii]|uniref:Protein kinase domain-containing protein n=1 Tax=Actinoplanes couchii TaxID=403638 RepID=A0ABQ3XKF7_9ACTN|nr:serine/threonine-protein kinase [Actinoplanes couchii]MDR6320486.1 putative Ser/Thr protein kinase [Actinoplanes couchii]GID58890.1 hypothetical protein Aco03nite_072940 [Actinoplanes couchii]